jgi:diadenosine tetraphosphate (Ap4A) HIT family hydrolase
MESCEGCQRVAEAAAGRNVHSVAEFEHSWLFLGDHQYYEGYCVLMAKRHVRELHEMPAAEGQALYAELMRATKALQAAFDPWKMNHACLGNLVQHVHWHIMPRYESDDDRHHNPWYNFEHFKSRVPDVPTRHHLIDRIRKALNAKGEA